MTFISTHTMCDWPDDLKNIHVNKRVSFSQKLISVRHMFAWRYAHIQARRGNCQYAAADAARFKNRISATEEVVAPILDKHVRSRVYNERFMSIYI